jgi:predicted dehydrogenase
MIKIGIVGVGGMGKGHINEFNSIKGVKVTACCDINETQAKQVAEQFNIPAAYADYREMLKKEKLDAVSCATTDNMHCAVSLAAVRKGLHIFCEKPLATTLAEAKRMNAAARKARVVNMVNFSYRASSGLQHAAAFVRKGGIGTLRHVESSYLQAWLTRTIWGDWTKQGAWMWRLSTRHGSAGTLGDLGCHIYDMTAMLCGDIAEIDCRLKTFDKGTAGNRSGEYVFDANDSFISTVTFRNGALGTIHSSRWASGHSNSLRVRVYGTKGGVEVDLDRSYDEYYRCTGKADMTSARWKTVKCARTPGNYQRFISAIRSGKKHYPSDFENGTKVQAYLHHSFESDKAGKSAKVR